MQILKSKKLAKLLSIIAGIIAFIAAVISIYDFCKPGPKDLAGEWVIENQVTEAQMKKYVGLHIKFKVYFSQDKNRIFGKGEKIIVNNSAISFIERTPLIIEGSIEGNKIKASFTDYGTKRITTGAFDWEIANNGEKIIGVFSSTSSDSHGISKGEKIKNYKPNSLSEM